MKAHACSYGIYPEGTRTRDGRLGELKPGSFKAAQKALAERKAKEAAEKKAAEAAAQQPAEPAKAE